MTQPIPPAIVSAFTPHGRLRASINLGNPILANKDTNGAPVGVSIDLVHAFARRLGVNVELVVFEKAAASVDAVRNEQADIGFFAIDPARSEGLSFTAPYVLIEGSYLVMETSPVTDNAAVDSPGLRIAVSVGVAAARLGPETPGGADALYREADADLYVDKAARAVGT